MTREEFGPILVYLSSAANREIPREQAEVYYDGLADLPAPAVRQGARRAVLESDYPVVPAVGRIRRLALEALVPRETPAQNAARLARERAEALTLAENDREAVKRLLDRHFGRD